MLKANTLATFGSSPSEMLSRPWDWILRPEILTYWIDPHYVAMISPTLWVLIIPAMAFAILQGYQGQSGGFICSDMVRRDLSDLDTYQPDYRSNELYLLFLSGGGVGLYCAISCWHWNSKIPLYGGR